MTVTGGEWLQDEADLAAALFFELRSVLLEAHRQKKEGLKATRVGVITPYRQQRKCLQDTFNALCGDFAKEARFSYLLCAACHTKTCFCEGGWSLIFPCCTCSL